MVNVTSFLQGVHSPFPFPPFQGDLLIETHRVIEFVIKLALFAEKLQEVQINTSGT